MKSILFIVLLITNIYGENCNCDYRKFLTNLIYSEAEWLPIVENNNSIPIEKIITDKVGRIWIQTWKSDPFPVSVSIGEITEKHIISNVLNISGVMFRSKYPFLEKYKDKFIRLRMYKKNCDLKNIILEIVIADYPDDKRKETIMFVKSRGK